jgi:hypothetical protein
LSLNPTADSPVLPPEAAAASLLRDTLEKLQFTEQGLLDHMGIIEAPSSRLRNLPRLLHATHERTPLNALVRLLLFGEPLLEAEWGLPPDFVMAASACGLLGREDGALRASAFLVPHAGLWMASDFHRRLEGGGAFDHVLTVNPTADFLARFALRGPVATTLDLCTGCGVQALLAARSSGTVLATDLNPRALAFAAFNAALNGVGNLECAAGSGFDAVTGRFDHILCNPPFIVAPAKRYLYRDSGVELDAFCRDLIRRAPDHLEPGGVFQMILEWVEVDGEPWRERLAGWVRQSDCDVWVLRDYGQAPDRYVQMRLRETPYVDEARDHEAFDAWMEYLTRRRVQAIHGGLILMRRRSAGHPWFRADDLRPEVAEPFGAWVASVLANMDFLEEHPDDEAILRSRLQLLPEVLLTQEHACESGHWRTRSLRLELPGSGVRPMVVQGDVANFLSSLGGMASVLSSIDEVARTADASRPAVVTECLGLVRKLLRQGVLVPAVSTS